jgi:hypothetical protein
VVNAGPDPASEISRIESYYLSHKKVAGLFATGGSDTYACGFVSAKYGLAKAGVIVAGFDLFPQTLGYINTGDVTFTVDQQAYLQGFLPVQQMYLYKVSGGLGGPADSTGEIDLSVSSTFALAPYVMALMSITWGVPLALGAVAGLVVGLLVGAINGIITVRFRVPSLITTVGTLFFLQGRCRLDLQ